jgi:arylsulfatase A-like enzyme
MTKAMPSSRSLVLITVDCLRADHVGFSGYARPTSPFLDSLAGESIVFSSAIVAGAPTYYSFPALFASRYPLDLGRDIVGLAPGEPTLASTLRGEGYATAAFCAGNPYLTRRFGYDQGFATFRDFLSDDGGPGAESIDEEQTRLRTRINRKLECWSHKVGSLGRLYDDLYFEYCQRVAMPAPESLERLRRFPSADVLVAEANTWLDSVVGRPFFLWLHLMDPHAPYYPVEESLRLMGDQASPFRARYLNAVWNRGDAEAQRVSKYGDELIALYDAGVRWVDAQVARLAAHLRELGAWDNCVVALTADHGEEFLDHGGRFHSPNKVTEELIRVPLLLRVPGQQNKKAVDNPFSLLHLAPTLLDALGTNVPGTFRGRSHWRELQNGCSWNEPAMTECVTGARNPFHRKDRLGPRILAVREKRYKLVWDFGADRERLFDLQNDPHELQPLSANAEPVVRSRLLRSAKQHLEQSRNQRNQRLRFGAFMGELAHEWRGQRPPSV